MDERVLRYNGHSPRLRLRYKNSIKRIFVDFRQLSQFLHIKQTFR